MNYTDIVGWAADGEALCEDCATHTWHKAHDNEETPIFAGTEVTDHDLTCDCCGEVIIEAVRYDFSVYMEGTSDWTFSIRATSLEEALRLARAGENEADGEEELYDYEDWEMHDGEPVRVYQSGVKGEVWKKPEPEPSHDPMDYPYLVMHPVLREQFPDGIKVAVDTLASEDAPMQEGLMFMFLAYVACAAGVPAEELSIYDLTVHEWEDGDWLLITA